MASERQTADPPLLSPDGFAILSVLVTEDALSVTELSQRLEIETAALTPTLRDLLDAGQVAAREQPGDHTAQPRYQATPRGRSAFLEQLARHRQDATDLA